MMHKDYNEDSWLDSPTESTLDPPYGEIQEIYEC